jgi:asparagine synthase (glutamine-hydrolysing)
MDNAVRKRNVKVVLGGGFGNMGLSYDGMELLPELFRTGRWFCLWREWSALVAARRMRWRGALVNTFGPWCPPTLWRWLNKVRRGCALGVADYTAIHPQRFYVLNLETRARARNHDFAFRPWKVGAAKRLHFLQCIDPGNYQKANLAHLRCDYRDPTADVRLLEFCLAIPTEQFLQNGMPRALARRALADRVPKEVLEEPRRGFQVADWHEDLTAARARVIGEIDRLEACPAAAAAIDLPRLRRLTKNWPSGGWERVQIETHYRYALLRAIAVGHFLRRATGSNA